MHTGVHTAIVFTIANYAITIVEVIQQHAGQRSSSAFSLDTPTNKNVPVDRPGRFGADQIGNLQQLCMLLDFFFGQLPGTMLPMPATASKRQVL